MSSPPSPSSSPNAELAGLPEWLYPLGFWVALALLAAAAFFPALSGVALTALALVPVVAAVWVAVTGWRRDRRLSLAALWVLIGLALVFVVRGLL